MKETLIEKTKVAAYLLWEKTKHDNPLHHWYCSEDIACFFEKWNILDENSIVRIIQKGVYDLGYIEFIRHIAYRIYIYTNNNDDFFNWLCAENLIKNGEWRQSIISMALIYNLEKKDADFIKSIRSDTVRNFYVSQVQN